MSQKKRTATAAGVAASRPSASLSDDYESSESGSDDDVQIVGYKESDFDGTQPAMSLSRDTQKRAAAVVAAPTHYFDEDDEDADDIPSSADAVPAMEYAQYLQQQQAAAASSASSSSSSASSSHPLPLPSSAASSSSSSPIPPPHRYGAQSSFAVDAADVSALSSAASALIAAANSSQNPKVCIELSLEEDDDDEDESDDEEEKPTIRFMVSENAYSLFKSISEEMESANDPSAAGAEKEEEVDGLHMLSVIRDNVNAIGTDVSDGSLLSAWERLEALAAVMTADRYWAEVESADTLQIIAEYSHLFHLVREALVKEGMSHLADIPQLERLLHTLSDLISQFGIDTLNV